MWHFCSGLTVDCYRSIYFFSIRGKHYTTVLLMLLCDVTLVFWNNYFVREFKLMLNSYLPILMMKRFVQYLTWQWEWCLSVCPKWMSPKYWNSLKIENWDFNVLFDMIKIRWCTSRCWKTYLTVYLYVLSDCQCTCSRLCSVSDNIFVISLEIQFCCRAFFKYSRQADKFQ